MNVKAVICKMPMQLLCERVLLLAMSLVSFHVCTLFLKRGGAIQCTVTGQRKYLDDFSCCREGWS